MAEESSDPTSSSAPQSLDLSSLGSLSLGPNWSSTSGSSQGEKKYRNYEGKADKPRKGGDSRRDRRPKFNKDAKSKPGGDRQNKRGRKRSDKPFDRKTPFVPTIEVSFYPEDTPFKALTQAVRSSCRTFELFEIARLILQKADRFVCVVNPLPSSANKQIFVSVPDSLPFESEEDVINHVLANHVELFFETEEIEVEAPKGSFMMVHKCGFTGDIIGAPNYHKYQQLLQEHHASKLPKMSFEKFTSRLESVKEKDLIDEWVTSMTKQTRYKVKDTIEGQPSFFDSLESARFYLITHCKDKMLRSATTARFDGKMVEKLPKGNIRSSIESVLEAQRRFPLDTANHLRGRLRRLNFAVYKKGSKGVSYICAVKRRFRTPGQVFAENLQGLIDFIEEHPQFEAAKLPKEYLGVDDPTASEKSNVSSVVDGVSEEEKTDKSEEVEAKEVTPLTQEEEQSLVQLRKDLHWLVHEGYVIEYSDGRLFAPPPREEAVAKVDKSKVKPKEIASNAAELKTEEVVEEKVVAPVAEEKSEEPVPEVSAEVNAEVLEQQAEEEGTIVVDEKLVEDKSEEPELPEKTVSEEEIEAEKSDSDKA